MRCALRDHEALPWAEVYCPIFQVDEEATLDHVEELIFLVVLMPMVLTLHDAQAHN